MPTAADPTPVIVGCEDTGAKNAAFFGLDRAGAGKNPPGVGLEAVGDFPYRIFLYAERVDFTPGVRERLSRL
jgi:hypothetical protein